jgi:dTDP-4-dehydrorhamnose reductase
MLRDYFQVHQPQYLINCAANTAVDRAESEKDLAMQVNGESVGVMAAVCQERHCHFIHLSTDYVFNGESSSPYTESDPVDPQNEYGKSKLEGERQAFLFNNASIIIRSSWIYSEHGKNFVKTMMRLMREKDRVGVVNDQFGSPTYAADLAEAIMQIIHHPSIHMAGEYSQLRLYHYCNKGVISWYEFALAIREIIKSPCDVNAISTSEFPTPARRPAFSALDTTRIEKEFNLEIADWKESLKKCIKRMGAI